MMTNRMSSLASKQEHLALFLRELLVPNFSLLSGRQAKESIVNSLIVYSLKTND